MQDHVLTPWSLMAIFADRSWSEMSLLSCGFLNQESWFSQHLFAHGVVLTQYSSFEGLRRRSLACMAFSNPGLLFQPSNMANARPSLD